jgi:putative membrane protein
MGLISKKYSIIIFYCLFVLCGSLSLIYIPNALIYSYGSISALIIISLPLFYVLYSKFGIGILFKLIISLSVFGLLIEYTGLVTGWPYGQFVYTGNLGYKLFGILPWTVGLSWAPLVIGSVAMVYSITNKNILRIILPVLILVVFDLLLDPVAVNLGMWSYLNGGAYYNVPVQNFLGWAFSGLVGSFISFAILNKYPQDKIRHLGYSFFINILFWSIVAFGLGLNVPFVFGILLMVSSIVIYYRNNEKVY